MKAAPVRERQQITLLGRCPSCFQISVYFLYWHWAQWLVQALLRMLTRIYQT